MSVLIKADQVAKSYGSTQALKPSSFAIEEGRILGLIGPNGAGKTTALKAILGLTPFEGSLEVLGFNPYRQRAELMKDVCFIADVAILPRWIKVSQALDFVETVHPRFHREKAMAFLEKTEISLNKKVKQLSKGMVVQLHLALVMAIDARLLVLDEPTLGLDILFRKSFYESLLNDYFDEKRTIIITTHQVEEIENLLTDLMFIQHGKIVLHASMEAVADRYSEVMVTAEMREQGLAMSPIHTREVFGRHVMLFEDVPQEKLSALGELRVPSVADLFVGKMQGVSA
ncbi:MAG: ABC transporter ATP-binding protein [Gammaproteobacteria bacterium]|nr:ABC transporter ATP-binding protein [Gammaproteobacteria bacterium]